MWRTSPPCWRPCPATRPRSGSTTTCARTAPSPSRVGARRAAPRPSAGRRSGWHALNLQAPRSCAARPPLPPRPAAPAPPPGIVKAVAKSLGKEPKIVLYSPEAVGTGKGGKAEGFPFRCGGTPRGRGRGAWRRLRLPAGGPARGATARPRGLAAAGCPKGSPACTPPNVRATRAALARVRAARRGPHRPTLFAPAPQKDGALLCELGQGQAGAGLEAGA
jgi:hypothetical protein